MGSNHWADNVEDRQILNRAEIAAHETLSPIERLEGARHPWVSFGIMPLFTFANAGVSVSFSGLSNPVAAAVVAGCVLGKPPGIFGFSWLAVRLGMALRSEGLPWGMLLAGGSQDRYSGGFYLGSLAWNGHADMTVSQTHVFADWRSSRK